MLEVPPSGLPALLTHVARQLDGLRGEQNPFQKSAAYQSMYLQVIREGLQRRPTVLLVDDAASLDPASMAILAALGRNDGLRADFGGGTGGLFGLPG